MTIHDIYIMAWRNMLRNKRRTFLSAFAVAFGVLLSVTFTASADYSYTNLINTSANMGFGHLAVEPPGFNNYPTLAKRLQNSPAIRAKILKQPGIAAAYERIVGQAMFATGAKSIGGQFIALDPAVESAEHNLFLASIIKGKLFSEENLRGALVGIKMAKRLNLRPGKKLIYTLTDKDGEIVSGICRVSGIFQIGEDTVDGMLVVLPLQAIRKILGYKQNAASLISIFIDDQRYALEQRDAIAMALINPADNNQFTVLSWQETQADLAGMIAIDRTSNYFLQFLIALLIAAGIFNTLLMSVMERRQEFGMLMAVGMPPIKIIILILLESFWIAMMGLAMGVIITTPWYLYMVRVGIDLGGMVGNDYSVGGVLVDPVLKFRLFKESATAIIITIFSLTILAGIYPAIKAGRVPPIASMRKGDY